MTTPHKASVDNGRRKVMRPGLRADPRSLARRARDTHLHSITFAFLHRGTEERGTKHAHIWQGIQTPYRRSQRM